MRERVVIIGKTPPPIGGVTIHIDRLVKVLKEETDIEVIVFDYTKKRLLRSFFYKKCIYHLHFSNKIIRCLYVFILFFLKKKSIVTFHGYYDFSNFLDKLSLKLCDRAIVLNEKTYNRSIAIKGKHVYKFPAFIKPSLKSIDSLNFFWKEKIRKIKKKEKKIFCTNATSFAFIGGKEVYMGREIISLFEKKNEYELIFSDPSGQYRKYYDKYGHQLSENILLIDEPHNFIEILLVADSFIRATTTDGDSLSVKEALFLEKEVFATKVVERPKGVILIDNLEDILKKTSINYSLASTNIESGDKQIIDLYMEFLRNK